MEFFSNIKIKPIHAMVGFPRKELFKALKQKNKQPKRQMKMNCVQFFRPLEKAAEIITQHMKKEKIPLQIVCYQKEGRILLEIILSGKSTIRDITDEDFSKWIHNITEAKGLLFDD